MATKTKKSAAQAGSSNKSSGKAKTGGAKSAAKPAVKKTTSAKSTSKAKPAAPRSKAPSKAKSAKPQAKSKSTSAASAKSSATRKRKPQTKPKGIIASAIDAVSGIFSSTGEPNAIELLKKDHDTVETLFDKVKTNEDGNNTATFKKIKEELDVHAHIEEMIFYPHLLEKGDKELKKIVREGIEEHKQVKMFLADLDALSGDNAKFKAKLQVLIEDVEHHVKEEENDMFPMVEDQIPEDTLQRLGSLMQGEKVRVKKMGGPPVTKQKAASAKP